MEDLRGRRGGLVRIGEITPFSGYLTGLKKSDRLDCVPAQSVHHADRGGFLQSLYLPLGQTPEYIASLPEATNRCDQIERERGFVIAGDRRRQPNDEPMIIGFGSTFRRSSLER